MKKILILFLTIFLFSGCSLFKTTNGIPTSFGRYEIPNTWEMNRTHSTRNKYFFTHKRDRNNPPNNISVESGSNKYKTSDHMMFRQAILRQLVMQMKGTDATINGDGWTTEKGYICYTFTIDEGKYKTVQHYIVGDYKYVLVHETVWNGNEEDVHNAAKYIVNSFTWK